jgi:uncharacterized protein YkwD
MWRDALLLAVICSFAVEAQLKSLQEPVAPNDGISTDAAIDGTYTTATGIPLSVTPEEVADAAAAPDAAAAEAVSAAAVTPQARAPNQYRRGQVQHNRYRALHSAPKLIWNTALANSAARWASRCTFAHSNTGGAYGENLYVTSQRNAGGAALVDAVKAWYAEIKDYNYNNPGFSSATGHFTQVVWKASRQLGCAVQDCANIQGFTAGTMVVCQYKPPGNVIGQFPQNVQRPSGSG